MTTRALVTLTRAGGYIAGGLAVTVAAVATAPAVTLWLTAALLLDIADGGLLA